MKKILSIILSLIFVFSTALPVFAAGTVNQTCPTIYVPGFAGSGIYSDKNDPSTKAASPDVNEILEAAKKDLLPTLITYIATGNGDPFAYKLTELVNTIFADYFNNPDGSAKGNSGTYLAYPTYVSKTSRLIFSNDWRSDPFVLASQLNDYINYICQKSGSEKVAIQCHSLGSVVVTTYLKVYGTSKISGIVFDSPALEGVTYVGELLNGNPKLAGDSLAIGIKGILGEMEYNELISGAIDMLELAGITDDAAGFLDELVAKTAPILYKETLVPLFACWPTIWAMTPDKYIDGAMEFIFSTYCSGEEYAGLKEKVEKYNTDVRPYKKDILLDFDANGRLAVISRYGFIGLPVTPTWNIHTDTVVDTASTSFGATIAPYGTSFSADYLEGKDMALISPDRTIDASTCLFPEKTWFIKNIAHDKTGATSSLRLELLFGAEEATIENSDHPRFMIYDAENEVLLEDKTEFEEPVEETKGGSIFRKVINFFTALFNFFTNLFSAKK